MRHLFVLIVMTSWLFAASQTLQERTYEVIAGAQEQIEAGAFGKAESLLDGYKIDRERFAYDWAYLQTVYGYLQLAQEDYAGALERFETAYGAKALPAQMQHNALYNIAQLQIALERYEEAIASLLQWLRMASRVTDEEYLLLASAQIPLQRYGVALKSVRAAMRVSEKPKLIHYRTLLYLQYELGRIDDAIVTLEHMIALFDADKSHYLQLSALYDEKGDDAAALAALELAQAQRLLETEGELMQLAQRYLQQGMPYRAARVLEQSEDDEQVGPKAAWLKLKAQSWLEAREYAKALDAYERAALKSEDGETDLLIAYLYMQLHEFGGVINAGKKALARGVKHPETLHMMMGQAYFEQHDYLEAKRAFDKAASSKRTGKDARQWLEYLEEKIATAP